MFLNSSALRSMVLVGMQPTFRHTPPASSRSTTTVFNPSCAARMADTYPPGPDPMMATSYWLSPNPSFSPASGLRPAPDHSLAMLAASFQAYADALPLARKRRQPSDNLGP